MGRGRAGTWLRPLCLALLASALWPAAARADGIGGYLQLNFSKGNTEITDASGRTTTQSSNLFAQQYRLVLDKRFYPNLMLSAGGTFERTDVNTEFDAESTDVVSTRILPFVDLVLNTQLITLGGGYQLNEATVKVNGDALPTLVREQLYTRFAYRPDGFPTLNLQAGRNQFYDKDRVVQDIVNDYIAIDSQYRPISKVQLSYLGALSHGTDNLKGFESRSLTNNGTASYSDSYWKNRMTFSGNYNINNLNSEFIASGQGEVSVPLFPFQGLSALSDTPSLVSLAPNASLVDGNLAAGSGIDIGFVTLPGDTRPRNLGLDFVVPAEVNTLYVWVDKRLPPQVSDSYSWDVYTSEDNREWVLRQIVSPAPFAPFDNRFEVRFGNVNSRFVKVVTRPLANLPPPTAEFPDPGVFRNIQVTELQAFNTKPASDVAGESSQTTQTVTLDARVRLLSVPSLYYQVTYFATRSTLAPYRYTLSNALQAYHQFNRVYSGSASVSRLDNIDQRGHEVTYLYNASLMAVPLPTLTHNITYSGRTLEFEGRRATFNSFYLTNTAQLYPGIDASLSGGIDFSSRESGQETQGATLGATLNLIPHRTLNVNLSWSGTTSESTGGGRPDTTSSSSGGTISASFTPFSTLYLYGDWSTSSQTDQPTFTRTNYGVNWAPFPDGTLHFNVNYLETLQSSDESRNRSLTSGVRWNINPRASLDVAYTWFLADSNFQEQQSDFVSSNLRITF